MGSPTPSRRDTSLRREVAWAALVGVLAVIGAAIVMRLWHAELDVPWSAAGDVDFELLEAKALLDRGWYLSLSDIGFPFGTSLHDFPQDAGSLGQTLALLVLAQLTQNAVVAVNLFSLLGFASVAITCYAAMRVLALARPLAIGAALLYAWLPFHFFRALPHLNFGDYTSVPIAALLVVLVLRDGRLFTRGPGGRWRTRNNALIAGALLLPGLNTAYFAVFTVVLLGLTIPVAALVHPRLRRPAVLAPTLIAALAIPLVPVAIGTLPTVVHRAEHGTNVALSSRSLSDSERYALKPATLLLPLSAHRLEPLADLKNEYLVAQVPEFNESDHATLGLLGATGLVVGLLALLRGGLRPPVRQTVAPATTDDVPGVPSASDSEAPEAVERARLDHLMRISGFGALLSLAFGTLGGGGVLVALLISPQIRSWNRIVVFIAFFAFLALALSAQRLRQTRRGRRIPDWAALTLVTLAVLFGLADQTRGTAPFVPPYSSINAQAASDRAFGDTVTSQVGPEPRLFTLPYVGFPEGAAPPAIGGYPFARMTVLNPGIDVTWGAMRSRPTDWVSDWSARPVPLMLAGAAAAGLNGVVVAHGGYERPEVEQDILSNALAMGGGPAARSLDGRFSVAQLPTPEEVTQLLPPDLPLDDLRTWALSPLRDQLVLGTTPVPGPGLTVRTPIPVGAIELRWSLNERGSRSATLAGRVSGGTASLVATLPDGTTLPVRTGRNGSFRIETTVAEGTGAMRLQATDISGRPFIENLRLMARPGFS